MVAVDCRYRPLKGRNHQARLPAQLLTERLIEVENMLELNGKEEFALAGILLQLLSG